MISERKPEWDDAPVITLTRKYLIGAEDRGVDRVVIRKAEDGSGEVLYDGKNHEKFMGGIYGPVLSGIKIMADMSVKREKGQEGKIRPFFQDLPSKLGNWDVTSEEHNGRESLSLVAVRD